MPCSDQKSGTYMQVSINSKPEGDTEKLGVGLPFKHKSKWCLAIGSSCRPILMSSRRAAESRRGMALSTREREAALVAIC